MEKYTNSILPKDKLLQLRLGEIWQFRDLLMLFAYRDFVAYYKQTILGPLWFFIQPLLTSLIFTLVFGKMAKIPTGGVPPFLFYMAGITAWNYFSDCFRKTSNTFNQNSALFSKVYFPRAIVPISNTITNLITFFIQLVLLLGFIIFYKTQGIQIHPNNSHLFLFPLLILLMAVMGLGFGMLTSALTTKYRDLQFLIAFGIQLFMYITPVIYPASVLPAKYQLWIHLNPMTGIIEIFRSAFLGSGEFSWTLLGYSTLCSFIIFFTGLFLFNHTEKNFVDVV